MTGTELRIALAIIHMKQKDFAEYVEVTPFHVSRWACGRSPIPKAVERLLGRMVAEHQQDAAQ